MSRSTEENIPIRNQLPFKFEKNEFCLSTWGDADFYSIQDGILILLEVEKGQKHPNTNVIKVWPYLEECPKQKILLIQVIRSENRAPQNRINLCDFIGKKLENIYPNRFRYYKYYWPSDVEYHIAKINQKLDDLIKQHV